jgi:predicted MFS family arabinose efflux permease
MKLLANRDLSVMYLLTAAAFGGTFAIFTFLAPILTEVTGVSDGTLSIALMIFGGATVVGNFAGGKLTDKIGTAKAMITTLIGLIASFVLIALAMRIEAVMLVAIAFWGIFAFAIPPIMHNGVVSVARVVAPDAVPTASGMNVAAFNLGISGGSFLGGRVLEGPGLTATPYAAIAIAIVALCIAIFVGKSKTSRVSSGVHIAS